MLLSPKYKDFIQTRAPVEFLEGTTFAGKTTVGIFKFMLRVAESPKKLHVLSGLDLGTIEKNIINKDLGIIDVFGSHLIEYNASGKGQHSLPHLVLRQPDKVEKIIYVVGYDNVTRWKKVLGGQYGCVFIDEVNIANMEYVREISMRNDYMMCTLNPDDPSLPIYKEYIDRSRPLDKWRSETPIELLSQLSQPHKKGWVHWFFSFKDNIGVPQEKKDQIIGMVAKGTKQYKNKIQGLRGRHTGLVFDLKDKHVVSYQFILEELKKGMKWRIFFCGVDTSYSRQSDDLIAFVYSGITTDGRLFRLGIEVHNNTWLKEQGSIEIAPSDVPPILHAFLDKQTKRWSRAHGVYIDSADAATMQEINKYKRNFGSIYNFALSYKKFVIIDRITSMQGWLQQGYAFILDECSMLIEEHNAYSWTDKGDKPEDRNDHTINADQYGWIPYRHMIGAQNEN